PRARRPTRSVQMACSAPAVSSRRQKKAVGVAVTARPYPDRSTRSASPAGERAEERPEEVARKEIDDDRNAGREQRQAQGHPHRGPQLLAPLLPAVQL